MGLAKAIELVANEIAGLIIVFAGAYAIVKGNPEVARECFQWGLIYIFGTGALKIARRGGLPNE